MDCVTEAIDGLQINQWHGSDQRPVLWPREYIRPRLGLPVIGDVGGIRQYRQVADAPYRAGEAVERELRRRRP